MCSRIAKSLVANTRDLSVVIVNEEGVAAMGVERGRVVGAFPKPRLETEFDKAIASARRFLRDEDAPDIGGV